MVFLWVLATLFLPLRCRKNTFKSLVVEHEGALRPYQDANTSAVLYETAEETFKEATKAFAPFKGKKPTLTIIDFDDVLIPESALYKLSREYLRGPAGLTKDKMLYKDWIMSPDMEAKVGKDVLAAFDTKIATVLMKAKKLSLGNGIIAIVYTWEREWFDVAVNKELLPRTAQLFADSPEIIFFSMASVSSLEERNTANYIDGAQRKQVIVPRLVQACKEQVTEISRVIFFGDRTADMMAAKALELTGHVVTAVKFIATPEPKELLLELDLVTDLLETAAAGTFPPRPFSQIEFAPDQTQVGLKAGTHTYLMAVTGHIELREFTF